MAGIELFRGPTTTATQFAPGERSCTTACINADGDIVVVSNARDLYGYHLLTERCFASYPGHDGQIEDVAISNDSRFVYSVGASHKIFVHEVATGNVVIEHDMKQLMKSCALSPHMIKRLAVVTSAQMKQSPKLTVFQIYTEKKDLMVKYTIDLPVAINCVKWPTDNQILLGGTDGKVYIVSNEMKEIIQTIDAHRGSINSISISPDNKFFATSSTDTTAATWSMENPALSLGKYSHSFIVSSTAISPIAPHIVLASSADQKNVATTSSGSTDFTVNFFNTIFQEEFASLKVHKSTVNWVGFTPDGYTLVTISYEGTMRFIRLGSDYLEFVKKHHAELEDMRKSRL